MPIHILCTYPIFLSRSSALSLFLNISKRHLSVNIFLLDDIILQKDGNELENHCMHESCKITGIRIFLDFCCNW